MRRIDIDKVTRSRIGYADTWKGSELDSLAGKNPKMDSPDNSMSLESISKPKMTDINRLSNTTNPDREDDSNSSLVSEKRKLRKSVRSLLTEIAFLALALTLIFTVFFGITIQHGNDMYPAIRDGDIILYYRLGEPVNTDACVYVALDELHTGRIAAGEGTVVSSTGDMQLTFDGIYSPVSLSDGIYERTYAVDGEPLPVTIEAGHYFILGDNRSQAEDSRMLGQVNRKNIKGRIVAVLRSRHI